MAWREPQAGIDRALVADRGMHLLLVVNVTEYSQQFYPRSKRNEKRFSETVATRKIQSKARASGCPPAK